MLRDTIHWKENMQHLGLQNFLKIVVNSTGV